ncbi:MAG: type II toxin-antitoxin system VapC family toxin [Nitrososphaerota archaeon]|nr:type II toxin-antitoxin system VapC family toxin [Nitrososphaerota archaeon]MDG7012971.1 type II toxin-antitoxin system VapC family toxin [Nitrososphaerota archaeon]MDG7026751.1 type II toxin-antitoxin system VapC family toxin [Nitrososphaerota archaeon]
MKCLDSDFLIAVLRGDPQARRKLEQLDAEGRHSTTSVNTFELFYGAHRSGERRKNVEEVGRLLQRLDVLPFDRESSERAGEELASLAGRGRPVDFRDAMIAAVAASKGLCVVTRDAGRFSRFKGLEVEAW